MQIVVIGATGNLGTALIDALDVERDVESVTAVSRRPSAELTRSHHTVRSVGADITASDLRTVVRGADVVVHLAWSIQPMHDARRTWEVNVGGTHRVIEAVVAERVPALVYASSVGAYAPKADDLPITEDGWPTTGLGGVAYPTEKAYDERLFDAAEQRHPWCRFVRLRPGLVLQGGAGHEYSGIFLGPLVTALLRAGVAAHVPLPLPRDIRFQVVHAYDVARAIVAACTTDVRGAFNLAAEPVLRRADIARAFDVRAVPGPWGLLHATGRLGFATHVSPLHPGWIDLIRTIPVMDCSRARTELGWTPAHDARSALSEAVDGVLHQRRRPTASLS